VLFEEGDFLRDQAELCFLLRGFGGRLAFRERFAKPRVEQLGADTFVMFQSHGNVRFGQSLFHT